ncbi:hypothetical protein KUV80_14425 [Fictibacillus nanhaiensis]|uniref:hypothetical protein n=1 Tax=Fictibacillus nanhaiensis TaxID=742169 RepID=UPI001C95662E|nr:hypothetical protein [Fictibacillus nanhaiensis]MBY6037865.1 hypothetical protein [Fictibacillus nanhaiensis]
MTINNPQQQDENRADNMHKMCKDHMYYHVIIKTEDGQQVEGIITDLDKKNVYMLVPQDMMPVDENEHESPQMSHHQQAERQRVQQNQRQYYGRPRYRRFYRQIFPLATLAALSLYPYYQPYPYPPYPYPYYPYPYY